MKSKFLLPLLICAAVLYSCKGKSVKLVVSAHDSTIVIRSTENKKNADDTTGSVRSTDYNFLSDSIFHGHKDLLKYYCHKYYNDTCIAQRFQKAYFKDEYEGIKYIGNINNNKERDSVFVLRPFSYCDADGQGYYFTDTSLPRLQTDSYCCHPDNLFRVGDIDEDGVCEIGQYYSSCTSHYKSLYVYSLKNRTWKEVGHCVYDLNYTEIGKPYSYFVRKIGKNEFEMLEITDLTKDKSKIGKRNWIKFSFR